MWTNENGEIQDAISTVKVSGVTIDPSSIILNIDASKTLTATVTPENAADKSVTWSSSNESVATVTPDGIVTAVAAGEATITAKAGDETATCKITVTVAKVPDPTINPSDNYGNDGDPLAS